MAQDGVVHSRADKSAQGKQKRPAPTEEQLIHAREEWEQGAAYRYVRHAANVGGCYSTAAICLAHDTLINQRLTDDLVRNRLAQGEFEASELNPANPNGDSVCTYVSVGVLNRLLLGMRGRFTPDEAYGFCDHHLGEADTTTIDLIAEKTSFSAAGRREFVEIYREIVDPAQVPYSRPVLRVVEPKEQDLQREKAKGRRRGRTIVSLLIALVAIALTAVAIVSGVFVFVLVALAAFALAALSSSGSNRTQNDEFRDERGDYPRRVWADDHNFEADGDSDHNW
ncbi:MAG: hypothetical protein Q4B54_12785, partial [Coriobacteriales bacterium]|nr:hypothetical protein [Coriobacteriales bacterium]